MQTKKEPRRAALAFACAAAMAASGADALSLNARGEGQVLIYPYYSVNAGKQSVVSVTNTSGKVKAVRFNAREAYNGALVIGFNVYLAPYDTWTAAIVGDGTGPARLVVADGTCTVPSNVTLPFVNYAYTGLLRDHPTALANTLGALERTREGFIEMIELGELRAGVGASQLADEATPSGPGLPADCSALQEAWRPLPPGETQRPWVANRLADIDLPTGGLYGNAALIDVAGGTMVSYEAQALVGFYTNAASPGALHFEPTAEVTLAANDNGDSNTVATVAIDGADGITHENVTFARGSVDAVSLVLMQSTLHNEFLTDPALGAASEWIVTMPTKRLHTNPAGNGAARAPFTRAFPATGEACHVVGVAVFDRSGMPRGADDVCVPGAQCATPTLQLCTATQVLAIGQDATGDGVSTIFGSAIDAGETGVAVPTSTASGGTFYSGVMTLKFDDPATTAADYRMSAGAGAPVSGLPVIGFAAEEVVNSNAQPGLLANYAGAYRHRGTLRRGD